MGYSGTHNLVPLSSHGNTDAITNYSISEKIISLTIVLVTTTYKHKNVTVAEFEKFFKQLSSLSFQ